MMMMMTILMLMVLMMILIDEDNGDDDADLGSRFNHQCLYRFNKLGNGICDVKNDCL